mgnify:CR=1 FL=1
MPETVFEKILNDEIPCHKVYEDEHVLAFLDIHPITKGHTVIIPKEKAMDFRDASLSSSQHLIRVAKELATWYEDVLSVEGFNLVHNAGSVAGQEVPYYHIHLLPQRDNDDTPLQGERPEPPSEEALEALRKKLRL